MPKVTDLHTVFLMFTASAGLVDWQSDGTGYAHGDFTEGIVELVARSIGSATRRGLVHGYRETEARLPTVRGRIDITALATRPWEAFPIPCRYDEFTPDIAENRVLLAGVQALRRLPQNAATRRELLELEQRFGEVRATRHPLRDLDRVRPSPVNAHYSAALALCRLVLTAVGLTHHSGEQTTASFLVDMNKLFEAWIGAELSRRLWPEVGVLEQETLHLSTKPSVPMYPDLLFTHQGRATYVADVKYKLSGRGIARNADYYQLLAYATALGHSSGLLIYASADEAPATEIRVVTGGQTLHVHRLALGGSPDDVRASLDRLATVIRVSATRTTATAAPSRGQ